MPRRPRPYRPHSFPATHRGTPLPPPLGKVKPAKPALSQGQLDKFEKAGIFTSLLVLELVLNFFFAWVLWVVFKELADNQVLAGSLPFWDAFWIALLIRFTVSFSRVLGKARDKE